MLIGEAILQHELLEKEYRRAALYATSPREKTYAIKRADQASQIASWLRDYMALREQIKKEAKK